MGDLNYQYINENNEETYISTVYSFSETGFYIDWYIKGCGVGQYSMNIDLKTKNVIIGNECMGLRSSKKIVKAFEKGLISQNDYKINYILEKLKYNFSPDCKSLEEGLIMLWKNAQKDEYRNRKEKEEENNKINPIILGDLTIYKFKQTLDYFDENYKTISFLLNIDFKWHQFGDFIIIKDVEKGKVSFIYSENLKIETMKKVIGLLENIKESELEGFYAKKDLEYIINIKNEWNKFKKECSLNGSIEEVVEQIVKEKNTTSNYVMI